MQSYFYIERSNSITIADGAAQQYINAFSGTTTSSNNNIYSSSNGDLTWDNNNWRLNVGKTGYYLVSVGIQYNTDQTAENINGYVNLYVDGSSLRKKPFNMIETTYGSDYDYFHFIEYVASGSNVAITLDTGSVGGAPSETPTGYVIKGGSSMVAMLLDNAFAYQQVTEPPAIGTFFTTGSEFNFFSQSSGTLTLSNLWNVATGSITSSISQPHFLIYDEMIGISGTNAYNASPALVGSYLTNTLYKNNSTASTVVATAMPPSLGAGSNPPFSEPDVVRGFFLDNTANGDNFRVGTNPTQYANLQVYGSSSFSAIQIPNYSKSFFITVKSASTVQNSSSGMPAYPFKSSIYSNGTQSLDWTSGSSAISYNTSSGVFTVNEAGQYLVVYHGVYSNPTLLNDPNTDRRYRSWLQYSNSSGIRGVGSGSFGFAEGGRKNNTGTPKLDFGTSRFQITNQAILSLVSGDTISPLMSASFTIGTPTSSLHSSIGTSLSIIQLGALTIAPTVTITSPTSSDTYSTTASTVALGGTTTNTPTAIAWNNYTAATSGTGTYDATTFTISSISLNAGANVIGVTGSNGAGSGSDGITVTYNQIPYILIATPTTESTYSTTSSTIALSGGQTYSSTITWNNYANTTSGSGNIVGLNFNLGPITLVSGSNFIAVTGTNAYGSYQDTITVTYTPPVLSSDCTSSNVGVQPLIGPDYTINLYSNNNTQVIKLKTSANSPCPQLPFSFSTPGPLSLRGRQNAPVITSGDKKN